MVKPLLRYVVSNGEKDAGQRETKVQDIDLDRAARKKVITSAICHVKEGITYWG